MPPGTAWTWNVDVPTGVAAVVVTESDVEAVVEPVSVVEPNTAVAPVGSAPIAESVTVQFVLFPLKATVTFP